MEQKRTVHFTSPGFRSQEITIAPDLDEIQSKRRSLIINEDKVLDSQLIQLDEGTKTRNRVFQERLDEIWRLSAACEAKLRTEAKEAVETILNMKDQYKRHLDKFNMSLQSEITSIFDTFDNEVDKESQRVDVIDSNFAKFVRTTVPENIERQSGEVSRQLRRAYETFGIEKKKEYKRETKLVEKASKHLQNTAQRFDDENALMSSCFYNLNDDVMEYERHAVRMHQLRNANSIEAIANLNQVSSTESKLRCSEDVEVLDTVIETQGLLQQTIILHFGTQSENDAFFSEASDRNANATVADNEKDSIAEEDVSNVNSHNSGSGGLPVMEKLNKRMEKVQQHQQQKAVAVTTTEPAATVAPAAASKAKKK